MKRLLPGLTPGSMVRVLILVLVVGGFALVAVETRFEHRVVLGKQWLPWIPVVYSGVVVAVGLLSALLRRTSLLLWCFAIGPLVGLAGFWFHGKGHLIERALYIARCCFARTGIVDTSGLDSPPLLAPLAVVGLSLIGLVACTRERNEEAGNTLPESD